MNLFLTLKLILLFQERADLLSSRKNGQCCTQPCSSGKIIKEFILAKLASLVESFKSWLYPRLEWSLYFQLEQRKIGYKYSNHLNSGHNGCVVFKWSSHVTWRTIQIPDILDHKQAFSVRFSDHHLNTRPYDNWTSLVFRWLLYGDMFEILQAKLFRLILKFDLIQKQQSLMHLMKLLDLNNGVRSIRNLD